MTEPLSPESLAWLRQSALVDGSTYSRVLHVLERLDALEADATEQSLSASFCNEAIVQRLEALEAQVKDDAKAWDSMRRASCDYHRRLQNLEALQQQPHQDRLDRLIALDQDDDKPALPTAPLMAAQQSAAFPVA